jgi:hypothetical protein
MIFSTKLKDEIQKSFLNTIPLFGEKENEILHRLEVCSEEQQFLMKFLYSSMPFSDIIDYDFSLFLEYVNHAIFLRENISWCKEIPERIFLNDVVHYRINSEDITYCRKYFYDLISDRIAGKSMTEAVLEINYWCAENATYQGSDFRTASPVTVYKAGFGRCGEESTFTVTALRSVGIPVRQVYTPRWAHCDDNHAWVEAWCDGEWYFFGACEPDPVLNTGWFTNAASRALLIHCRSFANFEQANTITVEGLLTYTNNTSLYAKTKDVEVTVVDENNQPVPDTKVQFQILNYSEYFSSATMYTNEDGKVQITLGLGDMKVRVMKDELYIEQLIHIKECDKYIIKLINQPKVLEKWIDYTIHAPEEYPMHPVNITKEQKDENKQRVQNCDNLRNNRIQNYYDEEKVGRIKDGEKYLKAAKGNFDEIYDFFTRDNNPLRINLLDVLADKDYLDITSDVLEEHLQLSLKYYETVEKKIFFNYILNPRVHYEIITPYRSFILEYFNLEEQEAFKENPILIWEYISNSFNFPKGKDYPLLAVSPKGALKYKLTNYVSKKVLFVSICRTLGIPARLNPVTFVPEYYKNNSFHGVLKPQDTKSDTGRVRILSTEYDKWVYYQTWTIAKLDRDSYKTLDLSEEQFENHCMDLIIEEGEYRIITTNRIPSGDILTKEFYFYLCSGEEKEIKLQRMELAYDTNRMEIDIPNLELRDNMCNKVSIRDLASSKDSVIIWLEEGKEPTEHILQEMLQYKEVLNKIDANMIFVIEDDNAKNNKTLAQVIGEITNIQIYYDEFTDNVVTIADKINVDGTKLPLVLIMNEKQKAVFGSSGYNVGVVEQIIKVITNN